MASYDAIVVGARCAGSPTAMLLARQGYRVLLVDKTTFPSDTLSTHLVHARGVASLRRWGLLDRLTATGCPPISAYSYDFGPFAISGTTRPIGGGTVAYAPRRTVLDKLLVDAAVEAGAELREAFTVEDLLVEDGRVTGIRGHARGGASLSERARIVIGADGRNSVVAKTIQPPRYHERPSAEAAYYAYWSGLPTDRFENYIRPERAWGVAPTHDGLTMVIVGWPHTEFLANRVDIEGNYLKSLELAPEFAERVRSATRETRFMGTGHLPGFFRKPYGAGWALVGDAGYDRDPCTGQGISDAFRDAELLAGAVFEATAGERPMDEALARYQRTRDEAALPMFELTCSLATLEPPPPHLAQLLAAVSGSQEASVDFVSMFAGAVGVRDFFSPDNVERILSGDALAPA